MINTGIYLYNHPVVSSPALLYTGGPCWNLHEDWLSWLWLEPVASRYTDCATRPTVYRILTTYSLNCVHDVLNTFLFPIKLTFQNIQW